MGKISVSVFAIFLTILTFHKNNLLNNQQSLSIQLGSEDLQVDNSINDVDYIHHRKTRKGTEILNELKGERGLVQTSDLFHNFRKCPISRGGARRMCQTSGRWHLKEFFDLFSFNFFRVGQYHLS